MAETQKKPRRRKLIEITTHTTGKGEGQTFGAHYRLPLGSATAEESVQAACYLMKGTNAQLDHAGSDYRLVLYDIKKREYVKVTMPE